MTVILEEPSILNNNRNEHQKNNKLIKQGAISQPPKFDESPKTKGSNTPGSYLIKKNKDNKITPLPSHHAPSRGRRSSRFVARSTDGWSS